MTNAESKAAQCAAKVGDSFTLLVSEIREQLNELKFKGIEFTRIDICFSLSDPVRTDYFHIEIWNSAIGTKKTEEMLDERCFQMDGPDQIKRMFLAIEWWKDDLLKNHQHLLKSQLLFP